MEHPLLGLPGMRCCICGKQLNPEEAREFATEVEGIRVATCSEEHRQAVRQEPKSCLLTSDTAVELIPL